MFIDAPMTWTLLWTLALSSVLTPSALYSSSTCKPYWDTSIPQTSIVSHIFRNSRLILLFTLLYETAYQGIISYWKQFRVTRLKVIVIDIGEEMTYRNKTGSGWHSLYKAIFWQLSASGSKFEVMTDRSSCSVTRKHWNRLLCIGCRRQTSPFLFVSRVSLFRSTWP